MEMMRVSLTQRDWTVSGKLGVQAHCSFHSLQGAPRARPRLAGQEGPERPLL